MYSTMLGASNIESLTLDKLMDAYRSISPAPLIPQLIEIPFLTRKQTFGYKWVRKISKRWAERYCTVLDTSADKGQGYDFVYENPLFRRKQRFVAFYLKTYELVDRLLKER